MATRFSAAPLLWALGATAGGSLALVLDAYVPSPGVTLAFPVALGTFSLGMVVAGTDEVRAVLSFAIAFAAAFLVVSIPLTWLGLARLGALEVLSEARLSGLRGELLPKWITMAAGVPVGALALWRYRRRPAGPTGKPTL